MKKFNISVVLNGKNASCHGLYDVETNNLKVLAGSKIRAMCSPNFKYAKSRNMRINESCEETIEGLILKKDIVFDTPTAAAKFCMGYEANGPMYWHTPDKTKLKDFLKSK